MSSLWGIPVAKEFGNFVCLGRLLFEEAFLPSLFQAKIETKALKAKRPGFTDDRYNETEYYVENGNIQT